MLHGCGGWLGDLDLAKGQNLNVSIVIALRVYCGQVGHQEPIAFYFGFARNMVQNLVYVMAPILSNSNDKGAKRIMEVMVNDRMRLL